eukprot:379073_1
MPPGRFESDRYARAKRNVTGAHTKTINKTIDVIKVKEQMQMHDEKEIDVDIERLTISNPLVLIIACAEYSGKRDNIDGARVDLHRYRNLFQNKYLYTVYSDNKDEEKAAEPKYSWTKKEIKEFINKNKKKVAKGKKAAKPKYSWTKKEIKEFINKNKKKVAKGKKAAKPKYSWTKKEIKEFINKNKKKVAKEKTHDGLIVVFRGHGDENGKLICSNGRRLDITTLHDWVSAKDYDPNSKEKQTIEEQKIIEEIPRIFIIDACRGGNKISTKRPDAVIQGKGDAEKTKQQKNDNNDAQPQQKQQQDDNDDAQPQQKQRNKLITIYGTADGYVTYSSTRQGKGGFLSAAIISVLEQNLVYNEQFGILAANMSLRLKQIEYEQMVVIDGDAVLNRLLIKPNKRITTKELSNEIKDVKKWMEDVIGVKYGDNDESFSVMEAFYEAMISSNGAQLCELLNKIKPGTCKGIRISSQKKHRHANIQTFREGCKSLGVDVNFCMNNDGLDSSQNIVDLMVNLYAVYIISGCKSITNCRKIAGNCGSKYIGRVDKFERKCGYGKMMYSWGDTFQGRWKNDKYHGWGKLNRGVRSYEGEFKYGELTGNGMMKTDKGSYIGCFRKRKFNGFGKLVFTDGASYEGNWRSGEASGHGVFTLPSGTFYVSDNVTEWKKGELVVNVTFNNGKETETVRLLTNDEELSYTIPDVKYENIAIIPDENNKCIVLKNMDTGNERVLKKGKFSCRRDGDYLLKFRVYGEIISVVTDAKFWYR